MSRKGKELMCDANVDKMKWNHHSTKLFLDLLTRWKKKKMRVMKWDKISEEFMELSGHRHAPRKLKIKHDNMRQNWQLFNRLIGAETGMEWNSMTCKVEASDEWWNARIAENPNYKKFRNSGFPLRHEQDILWGSKNATGEACVAPSTARDDGFGATVGNNRYTLQLPMQIDSEYIPEELSTCASPVETNTPMQEAGFNGKRLRNDEKSRKRKRKGSVLDSDLFQRMVGVVRSLYEEQRSYYAVKKEYYISKMNEKYVDPTYEQAVKALVDLDIQQSLPDVFHFGIELFNTNSQRRLFLALPERIRFNYIERQFKKAGGHAPLG